MSNYTEPLAFPDRLELAHTELCVIFEERDHFLSDDDVLDVADAWTIDAPYADDDPPTRSRDDYEALRDALFARLIVENEA